MHIHQNMKHNHHHSDKSYKNKVADSYHYSTPGLLNNLNDLCIVYMYH